MTSLARQWGSVPWSKKDQQTRNGRNLARLGILQLLHYFKTRKLCGYFIYLVYNFVLLYWSQVALIAGVPFYATFFFFFFPPIVQDKPTLGVRIHRFRRHSTNSALLHITVHDRLYFPLFTPSTVSTVYSLINWRRDPQVGAINQAKKVNHCHTNYIFSMFLLLATLFVTHYCCNTSRSPVSHITCTFFVYSKFTIFQYIRQQCGLIY